VSTWTRQVRERLIHADARAHAQADHRDRHEHDVLVSTGGFIEHVLTQGPDAVERYIDEVARIGFDILEVPAGFISIPTDDMLRLAERAQCAGLKAKPEVGIQFGAAGATMPEELEQEDTRDVGKATDLARRCLNAGAYKIMIESEGITEEVTTWRTDVVATIARELGLEKVMFEAADPEVFSWHVKNYGPEVNPFVDHPQIVQLECLRRGIWGTKSLWRRASHTLVSERDAEQCARQADLRSERAWRWVPSADRPRLAARRLPRASQAG
jgi:phosphosulfolactate synthase (CoM biosynthesis protein A)